MHTFFEYVASRIPELLHVCQRIATIPMKRAALPEMRFLERDEIAALFASLPTRGRHALRDRALLLLLYNTGARAQEVADLRVEHLDFDASPRVRLHGKGDKWRTCPLWEDTARLLAALLEQAGSRDKPQAPVFASFRGEALTRFGIYRVVRRRAGPLEKGKVAQPRRITPHVFRHTTAVHLLESGVEVNVIRGWLGHANPETTNRYAEITARLKAEALQVCEPPGHHGAFSRKPVWRDDPALLRWLASL